MLGAAAVGASLVFSTAAVFVLVPLALISLPLTFGLFAGAFVLKGIVFSAVNLVRDCDIFTIDAVYTFALPLAAQAVPLHAAMIGTVYASFHAYVT